MTIGLCVLCVYFFFFLLLLVCNFTCEQNIKTKHIVFDLLKRLMVLFSVFYCLSFAHIRFICINCQFESDFFVNKVQNKNGEKNDNHFPTHIIANRRSIFFSLSCLLLYFKIFNFQCNDRNDKNSVCLQSSFKSLHFEL